jgi:ABC-type uncharacterized transport system permease subunit
MSQAASPGLQKPKGGPLGALRDLPGRFMLERRPTSVARGWVYRLVVIVIALAAAVVYIVATVHVPDVLGLIFNGTFTTEPGIEELVVLATPFFLTALAVSIPLRVGLWNIGGEGQFFAGAWMATGLSFWLPHLPGPLLIALMLLGGAVAGAAWVVIPLLAKLYLNVNEIITTLMLNLIVVYWVAYWLTGAWRYGFSQGGTIESRFIPSQAHLPLLPFQGGIDSGIIIALVLLVVAGVVLRYSVAGYRSRIVGSGPAVAAFAGVRVRKTIAVSLLVAAALAGVAGVLQLTGNSYQLTPGLSNNTGYLGIAVAVLAGDSVIGIAVMSCLLAVMLSAGQIVQVYGVSSEDVFIVIGLLLLLSTMAPRIGAYRLVRRPHGLLPDELSGGEAEPQMLLAGAGPLGGEVEREEQAGK